MSEGTHDIADLVSRRRWPFMILLGVDLAVTGIVAVLLATEPSPLPTATIAAFVGIIGLGLVWAGFFGWVLLRRRVLFARHRVLAAAIGIAASGVFTVGGIVIAVSRSDGAAAGAVGLSGVLMVVVAAFALRSARARQQFLLDRRAELAASLASRTQA